MQPIEIALFGAVVALAAGLIGYILWLRTRARAVARAAAGAQRAVGSRSRAGADGAGARPGLSRLPARVRPRPAVLSARRARAGAGQRPGGPRRGAGHDLPELPPLVRRDEEVLPVRRRRAGSAHARSGSRSPGRECRRRRHARRGVAGGASVAIGVGVELMGKICPHCSRRYESDATFCGRDGAALVSVN